MVRSFRSAPPAFLLVLLAACSGGGGRPAETPVGADPVISTRSLDVMLTGLAAQVQLEATVAAPPAMWTFDVQPPGSLSWLTLSVDGLLSGTPSAVVMPAEHVTVRVTDAARHSATATLAVEVHGCDPAVTPTKPCFASSGNACIQGTAYCSGGVFGACTGGGSGDAAHCGPSCGPCSRDLADSCHGGDTCRCGTSPQCTGANTTSFSCTGGACVNACASGFLHCVGDASAGCETNVNTSADHCGACGQRCAVAPVGGSVACIGGRCVQSCPEWQFNDNGTCRCYSECRDRWGTLAYCTNFNTDVNNCRLCGNTCHAPPDGYPLCNLGTCDFECNAGFYKDTSRGCVPDGL